MDSKRTEIVKKPKGTWFLAKVAGTRIYLHWTFILLIGYVVVSEWMNRSSFYTAILLGLLVVAIFVTVILHELGHVLTARRFGCHTKDIILLPIGGVARMERLPEKPIQEIMVALAGPAVNLLIASAIYIANQPSSGEMGAVAFDSLTLENWIIHFMYANAALAVFNLVPAFPMDGGRILRGVLAMRMERGRATMFAARIGQIIAVFMFIAGMMYNPFLVFIGVFIFIGAQLEAASMIHQRFMKDATAEKVAMSGLEMIESGAVLRDVVDRLLDSDATRFIVQSNNHVLGHLDRNLLLRSIEIHGLDVFVDSIMNREFLSVDPSCPLQEVFLRIQERPEALVLVESAQGLSGFIDMDNILEYVLVQQAYSKNHERPFPHNIISHTV